ncbi:CinA family protein [Actinoplanes sp. L3-i22]|uniref:CinA family protein n=1 Tax=Actinoplanes sp. L3-i22 TaxID=2836373 RepID=UPI001C75B4D2|nr:CinA family protein [Actinoplanes sp. L3-i22]BCY08851.1 damage-inducible protein [Actinoplanes sp. L3-i22]
MTFVSTEQARLVTEIAEALIDRDEQVAIAESSTGGLVSACLLTYPGASRFVVGAGVLYSYPIREALLGMGEAEHKPYGGSTPELVLRLAELFRDRVGAQWGIGEGGAAGPALSPYGHPAGYTALAIAGPGTIRTEIVETGSDQRAQNMSAFTTALLDLFARTLRETT